MLLQMPTSSSRPLLARSRSIRSNSCVLAPPGLALAAELRALVLVYIILLMLLLVYIIVLVLVLLWYSCSSVSFIFCVFWFAKQPERLYTVVGLHSKMADQRMDHHFFFIRRDILLVAALCWRGSGTGSARQSLAFSRGRRLPPGHGTHLPTGHGLLEFDRMMVSRDSRSTRHIPASKLLL